MPIQQAIWRLGDKAERLQPAKIGTERQLEDYIVADPEILNPNWMIIGRQVQTDYRGFVDLIALQPDGTPVIIELKKDRTPRDVLAQTLDYASWVETLTPGRLQAIYDKFNPGQSLEADFAKKFGTELEEEALNRDHLMVIVATELDNSTERIVRFLSNRSLNINVLFFQIHQDSHGLLLSRAWLVDPAEVQVSVSVADDASSAWNGEFYVSFGDGDSRRWDDGRKYGFISASGGAWYTQTLRMLKEGDRIWVNVPKQGYVGVGLVTGATLPADEFEVEVNGQLKRLIDLPDMDRYDVDGPEELQSWFVPVQWIKTVPISEAIREVGFFGNQNSVAKPKTEKWDHTVSVLKKKFGVE